MTFFKKIDFILCGNHFRLTDSSESCHSGHPFPTGVRVSPSCRSYGHAKNLTSVRGCELSPELPGLPPQFVRRSSLAAQDPTSHLAVTSPRARASLRLSYFMTGPRRGRLLRHGVDCPPVYKPMCFSWSDRGVSSGQDHAEAMRPSQHARSGRRRHPRGWALVVARVRKGPPGF